MAITMAKVDHGEGNFPGGLRFRIVDITFDSSYPTGGEVVDNNQFGLQAIVAMINLNVATVAVPYIFRLIPGSTNQNNKIQVNRGGPSEFAYSPGGGDIKGSPAADVAIASGSLPTNGALLSSLADAANTTAFTIALQPDVPRTIGVAFKNTVAGASTGNATSVVIVGLFRGAAQTDTITFSAAELTSTAQNEVAMKYGVKPFDSVTSITPSAAQPASWQHAAGPGSKLGLPVSTDNNAESDILKLTKDGANLAVTGLYSTNETINFGTLADGADVSILYRIAGGEVQNTASLSGLTSRFLFLGT